MTIIVNHKLTSIFLSFTLPPSRGPNKYTRSWEDEEAYSRPLSAFIVDKEGENKKGRKPRVPKRGGGTGGGFRNNNSAGSGGEGEGGGGTGSKKQDFPALSSSQDKSVCLSLY